MTCDDFTSGTVSAAFGGTTTLVDFCMQAPGTAFPDALANYHEKLERCQAGDRRGLPHRRHRSEGRRDARGPREAPRRGRHLVQALHGLQGRHHGRRRDALQDDAGRRRHRRARHGARGERRRDRRARQEGARRGQDRPRLARAHAPADHRGRGDEPRDPARARRRVRRSTSSTSRARSRSSPSPAPGTNDWQAWGETCTQYLFIDETALEKPNFEGAKYVYTPPPRPKENQEHLWHALVDRTSSRWSRRTTARSTGTARRRSARTTSRRSRTAAPASRTACTCSTTTASARAGSR